LGRVYSLMWNDTKAIEYYLKQQLQHHGELTAIIEWLHFGCTSEDINNTAYALMLQKFRSDYLIPQYNNLQQVIAQLANNSCNISMLARTHGQAASPSTMGKEIANFLARLQIQQQKISQIAILAKFNGAVGNFNAHLAAYPNIHWHNVTKQFIEQLGLQYNSYTTQIEPHDYLSELFHAIIRYNTILLDMARDIWGYIALDYFTQQASTNQVGSSTMPHKINPIDFENAEGNLGIANALLNFLAEKLPISRWQRDLSDATCLRNIGTAMAHSMLAYNALQQGIVKLSINHTAIAADLNNKWVLLAEPIQTVMRKYGCIAGYEQLKSLTQGKYIDKATIYNFIEQLAIPDAAKQALKQLTPHNYTGAATQLAKAILISSSM